MAIQPARIRTTINDFRHGWTFCHPHLLALRLRGKITARQEARIGRVLAGFHGMDPFQHRALPYDLARIARQQVLSSGVYCRTADRLHLAAMAALGLRRLLTNDEQQATAARALGVGVLLPR